MGNLADRVGPKKRFVREAGSLQQHLLSDSGDVSLSGRTKGLEMEIYGVMEKTTPWLF